MSIVARLDRSITASELDRVRIAGFAPRPVGVGHPSSPCEYEVLCENEERLCELLLLSGGKARSLIDCATTPNGVEGE